MPKLVIPLTDLKLKTTKAGGKLIKLSDGDGLYLEVLPNGAKTWRFRFRQLNGKENLLTFGPYPDVGLAEARNKRAQARQLLRDGVDPSRERDAQRVAAAEQRRHTFERIAREWHANKRKSWSPQYSDNVLHRLEQDIFPEIGPEPIQGLPHRRIIAVLRKIEARGALEIAKRQRAVCRQIFSYAIQSGIADRNPVTDMADILQPVSPGHFPAITSEELPKFLRALHLNEARTGRVTLLAVRLMMLLFIRTSELIEAPWSELPPGSRQWVIPWKRMKLGKRHLNPIKVDHIVPLPRQAVELIEELRKLTGGGGLLFPNMRDHSRPMSNNTILKVIERMGYKGDMTGHGFRTLAMSTIKETLKYRHEPVDRQLAHVVKDKVQRAYDRAAYLDERAVMMQAWADYLEVVTGEALSAV